MSAVKVFCAAMLLASVAVGASVYSPVASAMKATTCYKTRACVGDSCSTWIVCDDGTMYDVG